MRVIHVAPTAFGTAGVYGGGERYPLELARAVAARVDCTLVTFGPRSEERPEGPLRIRILRALGHVAGHPAMPVAPGLLRAVGGADIVHVHHARSPASMLAAIAARARGIPVAVTDHGLQAPDPLGLVPRLYLRFLLVSRFSARELNAPPARTTVIHGGADVDRYRPHEGSPPRGVLYVGRITPHKGIDRLIRALPAGASLRVVGSAGHDPRLPESDYPMLLRRLAAGRDVRFLGPVADAELPNLYAAAQVVVLPSVATSCYGRSVAVSELLGLVLLEAMASGTPVVASRIGGVPEIVEDGVTGYLVEPGDERELHDAIARLLADPRRASRMGAAGRESVAAEFTWERCAERCLAAYEAMVAS